jgi:hypothetical protein
MLFPEQSVCPGFGKSVAGSHVHSLVLTDIASGWTEVADLRLQHLELGASRGCAARSAFGG